MNLNTASMPEFRAYTDGLIATNRTANLTLTVLKRNWYGGTKPLAGAAVKLAPVHGSCLFGCNLGGFGYPGFDALFKDVFDYATLTTFWCQMERADGSLNLDSAVLLAQWCASNGITVKGHPLIYAYEGVRPKALAGKDITDTLLWKPFLTQVVSALKSNVKWWDVVNEPIHFPVNNLVAPHQWVNALDAAARAVVNEGGPFLGDGDLAQRLYTTVAGLVAAGHPVHAVGLQAHVWPDGPLNYNLMDAELARFAGLNCPTHITEITVPSAPGPLATDWWTEDRQAEHTERMYRLAFASPKVGAITAWALADGDPWRPTAGLVTWDSHGAMRQKPAYGMLRDLLRSWKPSYTGATNISGAVSFSPMFRGEYVLTVNGAAAGTVTLTANSTQTITVR